MIKKLKKQKKKMMLKEHFRCHPHIIGFSNHFFYDLDLRIKTQANGRTVIDG